MHAVRHRLVPCLSTLALIAGLAGPVIAGESAASNASTAAMTTNTTLDVDAPLIPRAVLFGNPDKAAAQLSPDGKHLAYLAPVNGVLNVFVGPSDDITQAKPVTQDTKRGIRNYFWAYDNVHILYTQDLGGDENWKVYATEVATATTKDLTPFDTIPGPDGKPMQMPTGKNPDGSTVMTTLRPAAQINAVSEKFPSEILVGLNNRNPEYHDLYRCNIQTGELKLIYKNDEWGRIVTDDAYLLRFAERQTPDGGGEILQFNADATKTTLFESIGMEDSLTTAIEGFDKTGNVIYMSDSRGRNTAAMYAVDLTTRQKTLVAEHAKADVGPTIVHPTLKTIQAVQFNYTKPEWKVLDKSIEPDLAFLRTVNPGEIDISSRTLDDSRWIVTYVQDNGPPKVYLYDRSKGPKAGAAKFLFTLRSKLEGATLASMRPEIIKSRDGLDLVSYLTLPPGADKDNNGTPDAGPVPMVLLVHGGPWARDAWGYNGSHQWLANRGYAVLSVNFRGSTGFGKSFTNAGNLEWATKMHDDLIDAVNWAVDHKVAVKDKVAIMGGSYGGYATLAGLTFTPEVFACGVDIVGPSNLVTLLNSIPAYWAPMIEQMTKRVGDHRTEDGKKFLLTRSPITFVDKIQRPLLIGQGANDPRVKQTEADQIVEAMKAKHIPVTYVLFPDEGHGFARPENRMAFNAVAEAFLAEHLGGRFEPLADDVRKSTAEIRSGLEQVPGLSEAASRR
jgi:dipeptidyl aminopeptidase/acylaminoacyl peptidase